MSLYKDWDKSYSERMKNSTPIKNSIHHNRTANGDEHGDEDVDLISNKKNIKHNIKIVSV